MEIMDAWSAFMRTGNVLDYLRYSSLKNSADYFPNEERKHSLGSSAENTDKITPPDTSGSITG